MSYVLIILNSLWMLYEFTALTKIIPYFTYLHLFPNSGTMVGVSLIGVKWGLPLGVVGLIFGILGLIIIKDNIKEVSQIRNKILIFYCIVSLVILL